MKKLLLSVGALALAAGAASAQTNCPIRIGGLAPLSAPGSVTGGEAMRAAMRIATDEINAAGGVLGCQVELVVVDTEGLPERGRAVMERLITQDNVVAVGGGYHSSVGLASKDIANDAGIPVVFAETWNDRITADQQRFIFRLAPLSSEVAAIYANFAASVPGVQNVVIVAENTDYGLPASDMTRQGLEAAGITSTIYTVDIGTQDFSGIIQRIRADRPDMIIQVLTGEAAYNFTQQAAEAGIGPGDLPMTCDQNALESAAYWQNVPDGNLCFMNRVGLPTALYTERTTAFEAAYIAATGKDAAESYAMEAYDSIMVIAQAIAEAGSTDGNAIVDALEAITYHGVLGTITFPINTNNTPEQAGVEAKWWHQFPDPAITVVQYQAQGQSSTDAPVVYPPVYQTGPAIWPHQ